MQSVVSSFFLVQLLVLAVSAARTSENDRPIIGILSQPTSLTQYGNAYIAASYVKYVEGAGGRAAPIFFNLSSSELSSLLGSLNGVLFPGGGASFTGVYWNTVQAIWNFVLQSNAQGNYYPLWGTCQGHEQISVLASSDPNILTGNFDSENLSLPLEFTAAALDSRLFSTASPELLLLLQTQNLTMNNHVYGVTPASFYENAALRSMFSVLSTSFDRRGAQFVSTMEAYKLPITTSQWHPEKNAYEWNPDEGIPHSADAVAVTQWAANFLLSEARSNSNQFPSSAAETAALIYQYTPVFTEPVESDFEQCYFWTLSNV